MFHSVNGINKIACTGCGVCTNACPTHAVFMEENREGFLYPAINTELCINCGKCVSVCPVVVELKKTDAGEREESIYAAWSLDSEIRRNSTSGGIFSELALSVLDTGGYVCGAIYDDRQMVRHFVSNKKEDLKRIRQSKYVQSDMGNVYQKLKALLTEGETVLFCGSPCHCAAVYHYCLEEDVSMEKLFLLDFICRGANSPKVYRKFLDELSEKYGANITRVWFKDKTYGWNRFSTRVEFENGNCYLEDRYHDVYIRGYIEANLFIRPSCTDCRFKGPSKYADITLADFWGIELNEKMEESDGGTSMVMVNTEKGRMLLDNISSRIFKEKKNAESITKDNPCFYHSVKHGIHRDEFMKDLDRLSVIDNIERFLLYEGE